MSKKMRKATSLLLSGAMFLGAFAGLPPAAQAAEGRTIAIDFSKTKGEMVPKTGWLLIPNENVTDGRILPLHTRMIRDDIETQNLIWNNSDKDKKESHLRDIGANEQNRLDRIRDGVERMSELGIDYYPIMGYFPSWVSATGYAQARPKDMEVYKQWIRDIGQYVKDNNLPIDKFNVWNEDWGFYQDPALYHQMHETAWYAMHEIFPEVEIIGPSMQESPVGRGGQLIRYCAEKEIPADIIAWHFNNNSFGNVAALDKLVEQYPSVGEPKYYLEEYAWNSENGALAFNILAQADAAGVDEAIRGIWEYQNGMSELIKTNQDEENPNYRLCEWWQMAAYGSMTGESVVNNSSPFEPYIASIDKEKGEAKVLISNNGAQSAGSSSTTAMPIDLNLDNLPFQGNVTIDKYLITKSEIAGNMGSGAASAQYAMNRNSIWDEDEGIKYQGSQSAVINQADSNSTQVNLDFYGHDVYMLVIKTDKAAPSDFYLRLPDDNVVVDSTPDLKWEKSQGADSYTVTVATDKKMTNVVYTANVDAAETGIEETHTVANALPKDKMYYWTVTAHNANGDRAPFNNMYYSFTVKDDLEVPGAFTIYQPVNYTDEAPLQPRFTWSECRNADSYTIEISENKDFSGQVITEKVTNPTFVWIDEEDCIQQPWSKELKYWEHTLSEELKPGTTYYTRMTAENEHGTRAMDGKVHEFTTTSANGAPDAFNLTYPENNAVIEQRETLRWEDNAGAFFFELEIATDPQFENVVVKHDTITVPAYTLESNVLEPNTQYYWRVNAATKDKSAKKENNGGVHSFTTSATPAAPLIKVSKPVSSASIVVWQPVLGADSYTVKYGTKPGVYTKEITGLTGDRACVPATETIYCTVTAVLNGKESKAYNEIKVTPGDSETMTLEKAFPAIGADEIVDAPICADNQNAYVQFSESTSALTFRTIACKDISVSYRANADTKVSVYKNAEKIKEVELYETGSGWNSVKLGVAFNEGDTLKLVKENKAGSFQIVSMTPHKQGDNAPLVNVALGKTVTGSTTESGYQLASAVDGKLDTYWLPHDAATEDTPNFLNVDLAEEYKVYSVRLKLNPGWGARTQAIKVSVDSKDDGNYTVVSDKADYEFSPVSQNVVQIVFDEPVMAKNIRLDIYSNTGNQDKAQIAEFEVMAEGEAEEPDDITNTNLALKKAVVFEKEPDVGPVEKVVDGDKNTFIDGGSKKLPNVMTIDLAGYYELNRFDMYLPSNWGDRTQELEFQASNNGRDYTTIIEKAAYQFKSGVNHVSLDLTAKPSARYVRVIGYSNNESGKPGMQFSEFEVYGGYGIKVTGVELGKNTLELSEGASQTLNAKVMPENATNISTAWSSSDLSVATVNEDGLVTAIGAGSCTIRARTLDGSYIDSCTVTVLEGVDKTALTQMIAKYEAEKSKYTPKSWDAFQIVLTDAKLVLAKDGVTQPEINAAYTELLAASLELVERPNKDGLKALIDEAEALDTGNCRPGKVKDFEKALAAAQKTYGDPNADLTAVNAATDTLLEAMLNLKDIVDRTELNKLVAILEKLDETQYFQDGFDKLKEAIAQAKLLDDDASVKQVKDAYKALQKAYGELVRLPDKTALANAVKNAETILKNSGDYMPSTIAGLDELTQKAKAVLNKPEATIDEVTAELNSLTQALAKARVKEDRTALLNAIDKANKLDAEKYTVESYAFVKGAAAKAVLTAENGDATKAEIEKALADLNGAMDNLVLLKDDNNGGSASGGDVDTGEVDSLLVLPVILLLSLGVFLVLFYKRRKNLA